MPPSPRLVLFDIDATLLSAGGAGRHALRRAFADLHGPHPAIDSWVFAGKTDPQISRELLSHVGMAEPEVQANIPALMARYLEYLHEELPRAESRHLKPGVGPLLDTLASTEGVLLGLLTGNLEPGARLKLGHFGIDHYFRLGAYGSDHGDRPQLPAIAISRAVSLTGHPYRGKEVVIIGDTEHDIKCGAALGVRAIGVATGIYTTEELKPHGADHVFEDLSDTGRVLAAILDD